MFPYEEDVAARWEAIQYRGSARSRTNGGLRAARAGNVLRQNWMTAAELFDSLLHFPRPSSPQVEMLKGPLRGAHRSEGAIDD